MEREITIRPADPDRDYDGIVDLTGKTFKNYWEWRERCRDGYILNGPYDWESTRLAFAGDKLVAHFGVWDLTMRFGEGRLRVAGIGAVACHPDWRRQGIVARLARAVVEHLDGAGYHATLLYGISDFYHRFGYVTIWPEMNWRARAEDLPSRTIPKLEDINDWEEIAGCANFWYRDVPGTAVRPTYRRNPRSSLGSGHLWRDGTGAVSGYVVCGPSEGILYVSDLAGEPEVVMSVLKELSTRSRCEYLLLRNMPPASPYVRSLRRGPYRATEDYRPNGGPMGRIIALSRSLSAMKVELTGRYEEIRPLIGGTDDGGRMGGERPLLVLSDSREQCVLSETDGVIAVSPVASLPSAGGDERDEVVPWVEAGESVVRLIFGTHSVDELIASGEISVSGRKARMIASVLFPKISPSLPAWDRM